LNLRRPTSVAWAQHPTEQLKLLHGSLFDVKCSDFFCSYVERDNYMDLIVPDLDVSDINVTLPNIDYAHLPKCPQCKRGLLRPGVVWFGEMLPQGVLKDIDEWMATSTKIDLIMVIGTGAKVYPAAGYVDLARMRGARVAVINTDKNDVPAGGLHDGDWFFEGDSAEIVPELLKAVNGHIGLPQDAAAGAH
jgi:NAD-dependent deacetylase sirtuin 5